MELSQLVFLKKEDSLNENERNIFKKLYLNNQKVFLVCYQLWRMFDIEFYYLNNTTIKFAIGFEMSKVKRLLDDIEVLTEVEARVLVFSKSFF